MTSEQRDKQVVAKEVKRDNAATKTLKKSNKEQHTGWDGSALVSAKGMLSGLDTCKDVRERETLPPVFRNENRS
jgi:hypothetical protein